MKGHCTPASPNSSSTGSHRGLISITASYTHMTPGTVDKVFTDNKMSNQHSHSYQLVYTDEETLRLSNLPSIIRLVSNRAVT